MARMILERKWHGLIVSVVLLPFAVGAVLIAYGNELSYVVQDVLVFLFTASLITLGAILVLRTKVDAVRPVRGTARFIITHSLSITGYLLLLIIMLGIVAFYEEQLRSVNQRLSTIEAKFAENTSHSCDVKDSIRKIRHSVVRVVS